MCISGHFEQIKLIDWLIDWFVDVDASLSAQSSSISSMKHATAVTASVTDKQLSWWATVCLCLVPSISTGQIRCLTSSLRLYEPYIKIVGHVDACRQSRLLSVVYTTLNSWHKTLTRISRPAVLCLSSSAGCRSHAFRFCFNFFSVQLSSILPRQS